MNTANLIPIDRQLRDARSARLTRWALADACALLVLAAVGGLLRVSVSGAASMDATQSVRLDNEIAERTKAANQLRAEIRLVERKVRAIRVVTEHPDYSVLLALLSETAGAEIRLKQCAIDRPQHAEDAGRNGMPTLRLGGLGQSQSAVTSLVLRLEATGVFEQVTLLRSNEQVEADGPATAFQLECLFGGAAKEGS